MTGNIGVLYQDDVSLYRIYNPDMKLDERIAHPYNMQAYGNSLGDLYDIMGKLGIDRLWVFPDTDLSRNMHMQIIRDIPEEYHPYTPPKFDYDGKPRGISMYRKGENDRYIFFPAHMECRIPGNGDRGQWDLPDHTYLFYTVYYIEQELSMPLLWSGGKMGEELLRRSHTSMKSKINPLPAGLGYRWDIVAKSAMDRLVWKTRISIESPWWLMTYVVGYDKNGQYVGASNSAILGNGGFRETTRYEPKSCGFWHYQVTGARSTAFNGIDLPCPLDIKREWASTALVEAAHKVGVQFTIDKGIVWDEKGRYLEKWACEMWEHRQHFRNPDLYQDNERQRICASNAQGSMKQYANAMVGRFMNDYSKEYSHKDWNMGVVHQAVANMVYTLERLYRVYGITPILINKDALYFLTNDPAMFEERTGLVQHSNELRGYKRIGVSKLTDEIKRMFASKRTGVGEIEEKIKEGRL